MIQFYTYLHCKPDGTPFYVVKGRGTRSHKLHQRGELHRRVVAKYGAEDIKVYVFPTEDEVEAYACEVRWIAQLRADGVRLVNFTDGGEGTVGFKYSAESRARMSEAAKRKIVTPEARAAQSKARKGRKLPSCSAERKAKLAAANIGKKYSAEVRAKVALAGTGRKHSEETKAKMALVQKERIRAPEELARLRTLNVGRKRKERSAEHRANIAAALSGKKRPLEVGAKISASRKAMFAARRGRGV